MRCKVKVDRDLCIGAGSCVAVAPKVFELDAEGKAIILKKDGTKNETSDFSSYEEIDDTEENILNAARSCPVNAIIIIEVDDQGKEIRQVWPQ